MQQEIEVEQNIVDKGGLPFKSRGEYTQHMEERERELKEEYRRKGLDPRVVSFHTLDDIEFYSKLLDEVVYFERSVRNTLAFSKGAFGLGGKELNQEI